MDKEKIAKDFEFLRQDEDVLAVLVFGSTVEGKEHDRSDIDVCVVAPGREPWEVLKNIYPEVDTEGKNYDVHTFEEFGLRLKHRVMEDHEILWARDRGKLGEYFYKYQKLWKDQAKARGVA